jgi:hypothetical protein
VWGNLKANELANLCPDTINEVADIAEDGLDRIRSDPALGVAFLSHAGSAFMMAYSSRHRARLCKVPGLDLVLGSGTG